MITISLATASVPHRMDGHSGGVCVTSLFILLVAFLLPASVHAQFQYVTNNGTISITKYIGAGGDVSIPDTIDGLPVVNIENAAFYGSSVTGVMIPDSVTNLGTHVFAECTALTDVVIPVGVTSIGIWAFSGCPSLTSITVDPLNTAYSSLDGVLFDKNQTTLIQCPGGKAGAYAIPDSVTSFGHYAFYFCANLTSVTIGQGIASIGEGVFGYCTGLINVTVPDNVTAIGDQAFLYCTSLAGVTIPDNLTHIGNSAFSFCTSLTSLTIPNSVTNIGIAAFEACGNLTGVFIGSGVTRIGETAFYYCTRLTSITVDPLNAAYSSLDGVLFDKNQTTLIHCPWGKAGAYAIPDGVTSIRRVAFLYCTNLSSITIPSSVTSIGDYAFEYCNGLTHIIIPDSVTHIGDQAFYGCSSLIDVLIGDGVTSIGPFAFQSCASLTSITVDPLNSTYSSLDGVLFDKSQTTLLQFPGGKGGTYTVPDRVMSISDYSFRSCTNLTGVIIPDSVSSVGRQAFIDCTALTDVTVGKSVLIIWQEAFYGCSSLMNLYFQGNAPWVANRIFDRSNLATVYYLPGSAGWELTFDGRPTAIWHLPYPVILAIPPAFGVLSNGFGFVISWATNLSVVVESCTHLSTADWTPVGTNDLIEGSSYFSDPQWTNDPTRFYRLRSP